MTRERIPSQDSVCSRRVPSKHDGETSSVPLKQLAVKITLHVRCQPEQRRKGNRRRSQLTSLIPGRGAPIDGEGRRNLKEKGRPMSIDRRTFFKGALLGGTAAAAGLAGCAPKAEMADTGGSDARDKEREAFEAAAAPIEPASVPESWDEEAEVIVVGSGAAGINAAIRLGQAGYQVLVLERNMELNGNSKHSSVFSNMGGHKAAEERKFAYPEYPYDVDRILGVRHELPAADRRPRSHVRYAGGRPEVHRLDEREGRRQVGAHEPEPRRRGHAGVGGHVHAHQRHQREPDPPAAADRAGAEGRGRGARQQQRGHARLRR